MVDLHCHILPGIDDGPSDVSEFLEMASAATETGITHIYATPHHLNGQYENNKIEIIQSVSRANYLLHLKCIPLFIHPGQELRIHQGLIDSIENNEVLTLDNKGTHLLLELPAGEFPSYTFDVIYELLLRRITPIIVHPERNKAIIENPKYLYDLVKEGAMTQVTSGSILGIFGKRIKSFSEKMIVHQLAHFIATDAHNSHLRGFSLKHVFNCITAKYGEETTFYFKNNAQMLMLGHNIHVQKPIHFRRRFMGVF
ncbi:tyrosine protein phosphatase [Robertmurraya korlensis]|uniref:tyrosine-protein phosphatase n=1 Tax=Robertmurraya korlensis TaxID=519977 RepID=UPI0020408666|nr:CpsB/CapC family capsule biosynthesis tyrosine phosphatase [Robertmurraya korlensis]MCM3600544.1 tyrosine protein phosphatase [Robertmurraya korlensis]